MTQVMIVIVEYRAKEETIACLESIDLCMRDVTWQCTVVSNSGYPAAERAEFSKSLTPARLIDSGRNRGYAGGVNYGLREALKTRVPAVLILNPDCRFLDGSIGELLEALDGDPRVGIVAPSVVDGEGRLQPSCRRFPKPWTFLLVRGPLRFLKATRAERRRYLMADFDHRDQRDVHWVSGGAMLVRSEAIRAVGLMDESYFLYMEDVDWCRSFWRLGWKVRYCPRCTVRHDGKHQSVEGMSCLLRSAHPWFHLGSMFKYFWKWNVEALRGS